MYCKEMMVLSKLMLQKSKRVVGYIFRASSDVVVPHVEYKFGVRHFSDRLVHKGDEFTLGVEEAEVYFGELFCKLNDSDVDIIYLSSAVLAKDSRFAVFYNLVYLDERWGTDE